MGKFVTADPELIRPVPATVDQKGVVKKAKAKESARARFLSSRLVMNDLDLA